MPTPDQDRTWMHRALALARRGIALTAPNPAVGCVLLDRDGQLAGEGWHQYDLKDHAEVAALKAAGCPVILSERSESKDLLLPSPDRAGSLRGGTAYVTLEPCNHTGRTPPCTQALIAAGVACVVAATIDPNPAVSGQGLAALRAAGIQTEVGLCQADARRLNEPFARWIVSRRPFVLMKVAMSLDGRIAPAAAHHIPRQPYWITSEAARAAVQTLRWQADAAMVGIDTVLADDPLLTDRSGLARRRPIQRLVLDSALRMPLDCKLVATANNDVQIFTVSNDQARIRELTQRGLRVEVLPAEHGRVPLDQLLAKLGEQGILTLLTETGTRLNTALLSANLVDRIQLFVSPQIMGSDAVPAFKSMPAPLPLAEVEVERYANDLSLNSLLNNPWPQEAANRE